MHISTETSLDSGPFRYVLQALLVLAFLTGGSSQVSGWDDTAVQLLAVPVLAWALWRIAGQPASAWRNLALGVAALIAFVPLLQMLPVPESLWRLPEARQRLAGDLAAVGANAGLRWSLVPQASERSALFLLPALALFAGTVSAESRVHRQLLWTVMLLALFSLLLAFLQLGVPAESVLNPFPRWAAQFNGVFANQNHQGTSLVVGIVISFTGMLAALRDPKKRGSHAWKAWTLGFVALFCLCALPLTQSRAAVLIGTFVVALLPVAMGMFHRHRLAAGWGARLGLGASLAMMGLGIWATVGWMQVDMVDEMRGPLREAALMLGHQHSPLGTGMGAFVPAFEQGSPDALLIGAYVNHVHNEYLQWWMEAGWLGALVAAVALAILVLASVRALGRGAPDRGSAVAAVFGLTAMLLHSWVDYPLRTGSLAAVAGVLGGIIVVLASRSRRRESSPLRR